MTPIPEQLDGRARVVVAHIGPSVDGGRHAVKRVAGERVVVEADLVADGHDVLRAVVRHRPAGGRWSECRMELTEPGLDRWVGEFTPRSVGDHEFQVVAWVDPFASWLDQTRRRIEAGQDVAVELVTGAELVTEAAAATKAAGAAELLEHAEALLAGDTGPVVGDQLARLMGRYVRPHHPAASGVLRVQVDRERAGFSAWYELFPRSFGGLKGVLDVLPYVAGMGFDVLYLPPVHPIGRTHRKGADGAISAGGTDPGSPWAIGGPEGGHTAVHPDLGTIDDLVSLVQAAKPLGIEVALDLAFQCSPDHPWVTEHPEWFRHRADGTIRYAENPPKRYQDIYPLDFETESWPELWAALEEVVRFWMDAGVRIFRVDNPHTKPLRFWAWLIDAIRATDPDVIFLAEAFTRPRVMEQLAKLGFTQSYTYFAWRNSAGELREYFEGLNRTERAEYMRPNVWPNTPDILTGDLQVGGRPYAATRAVLAATLAANYGVYGPAFELGEHEPREPGSEEYRHSEKYEVRSWDLDAPWSLRPLLTRLNRIRREHPALWTDRTLRFHAVDGDDLLCYSKRDEDTGDTVLVVVNVHPTDRREGMLHLDLGLLGLEPGTPFTVHDLLGDGRWVWDGPDNYVALDPRSLSAHVFEVTA